MAVRQKPKYRWPGLRNAAPTPGYCRRCRQPTTTGWYDGFAVIMDRYELDPRGEAEAWILGLPTYHSVPPNLYKRSVMTINEAWNPVWGSIHRVHRCGQAPTTYLRVRPEQGDECPF